MIKFKAKVILTGMTITESSVPVTATSRLEARKAVTIHYGGHLVRIKSLRKIN